MSDKRSMAALLIDGALLVWGRGAASRADLSRDACRWCPRSPKERCYLTCLLGQSHFNTVPPSGKCFSTYSYTEKMTTPFAHDAAVVRIVSGSFRAFQRRVDRRQTRRQWSTAPSDVLSQAPPSEPSSPGVQPPSPCKTPCCRWSHGAALLTSATSAAAAACSAAAAGPYVHRRHALTARIARIEAGGARRAHAHRGRSRMLIDRGENVLVDRPR